MMDTRYGLARALRHQLHAHPELSGQEAWTKARLMAFFQEHTHLELVDRGSWFYALCRGRETGSVAFRADFDALPIEETCTMTYRSQCPGVAHKCGHDGHSAALALLGLTLEETGAERDVYLIFQPAEEVGGGGEACAALLAEQGIKEVYAFHNMPGYPLRTVALRKGTMNCASKGLILQFEGVSTHASTPELGRNPAQAVAKVVGALPSLTRREDHQGLVMATVVQIDVGEPAFGISAYRGALLLTLRAQYQGELDTLQDRITTLARQAAEADGLTLTLEERDVFPETANHPAAVEKVEAAARALGLPVVEMPEPMRGSEDFGWYLRQAEGAMFLLGDGEDHPPLHSTDFDFPDELLEAACELFQALI